jgi:hypothetical protein
LDPERLILTALAAGASAGTGDAPAAGQKETVNAAYVKLRGLVKERVSGRPHGELALQQYESAPQTWEAVLAAELTGAGAAQDGDLVAAAQALMDLVDQSGTSGKYNVTVKDSRGVQVGDSNFQVNKF